MTEYQGSFRSVYGQTTVKSGDTISCASVGTTETNFASSGMIPANFMMPGQMFYLDFMGTYTASVLSLPSITARAKIGSTTIASTGALSNLVGGTFGFYGKICCKVQSVGTTGMVRAGGILYFGISSSAAVTVVVAPTTTTIDTTIAQALQLSAQYSSTISGNSVVLQQFDIHEIRPPAAAN